jgi:hypothetical protein
MYSAGAGGWVEVEADVQHWDEGWKRVWVGVGRWFGRGTIRTGGVVWHDSILRQSIITVVSNVCYMYHC